MKRNLEMAKQMVKWQAEEVTKSYTALGNAYKDFFGYMAMLVDDECNTELWFDGYAFEKLKEAEKNTEHQTYMLRRLIDDYKEAKALAERRADEHTDKRD